jgi:hypothetical protein
MRLGHDDPHITKARMDSEQTKHVKIMNNFFTLFIYEAIFLP